MHITKHAKDRLAERFLLTCSDEDLPHLIDALNRNWHTGFKTKTHEQTGCKHVTVNFKGVLVKFLYKQSEETITTVLNYNRKHGS